jgi:hypothetical protein
MDGALVDARQVGATARVVVHSAPRLVFPSATEGSDTQRTAANRAVIAGAGLSAWLPRYELTVGAARHSGQVGCAATSRPAAAGYSGTSMLTVLTFDLSNDTLDDGQPVMIVADGGTVYSDGSSLYVAGSQQWTSASQPYTSLYKFDISRPGRPAYEAAGTVPGWLIGPSAMAQYALSAWNGALRVATTTAGAVEGWSAQSRSAVYVLRQSGDALMIIGEVGGLGRGEQIYAVRFAGPVGYVVTFRQTDPLYTIDLSDPARPRLAGKLLLRGYSAYLDPIDDTHLIGVGQDATAQGQTQGTQVSLFDVSNLAAPVRQAVYDVPFGHSEAEFDPHAFLYWPATGTLVIPMQLSSGAIPARPASEAVVLQVREHSIARVGTIIHPPVPGLPLGGQIRRSLIIGWSLWTMSDTGLKANALATMTPLGWVPFE